jgi:hypothetical protein
MELEDLEEERPNLSSQYFKLPMPSHISLFLLPFCSMFCSVPPIVITIGLSGKSAKLIISCSPRACLLWQKLNWKRDSGEGKKRNIFLFFPVGAPKADHSHSHPSHLVSSQQPTVGGVGCQFGCAAINLCWQRRRSYFDASSTLSVLLKNFADEISLVLLG